MAELTGDIENVKSQEIGEADVICATPEKFGTSGVLENPSNGVFLRCRQSKT